MVHVDYRQKRHNGTEMLKRIDINTYHTFVGYHMSLLVLSRPEQWVSAEEQVPAFAGCASAPKTLRQLRRALEDPFT